MLLGKLSFFAYVISRKRSANQQKQLCNDAPRAKTSQSAKNQLDPAKNKNWPKMLYVPFLHESLQFLPKTAPKVSRILILSTKNFLLNEYWGLNGA